MKIKKISALTAGLALILVALGSFVRATGAGLACPDWPLCYGRIIPEMQVGVFQEVAHRFLAAVVSILVAYFGILTYRVRFTHPGLWTAAKVLLCMIIVQVILGGLTVIMKLNPFIVTAHLAFGTIIFLILGIVTLERIPNQIESGKVARRKIGSDEEIGKGTTSSGSRKIFRLLIAVLLVSVFLQIVLGGFVGSSGASLVCSGLFGCETGVFMPRPSTGQQHLHMTHRILAYLILGLTLLAIPLAFKAKDDRDKSPKGHMFGMVFLILLQIVVGISNVYYKIPVSITVLHLTLAQLILLGLASVYQRFNERVRVFTIPDLGGQIRSGEVDVNKSKMKSQGSLD